MGHEMDAPRHNNSNLFLIQKQAFPLLNPFQSYFSQHVFYRNLIEPVKEFQCLKQIDGLVNGVEVPSLIEWVKNPHIGVVFICSF